MRKTLGEVCDPQRQVILIQKALFCMQKPQMRVAPIATSNSDANHVVLQAQNDM